MFEVRRSPIHGRGLFATSEIPVKKRVGTFKGSPTTKEGRYVFWLSNTKAMVVENDLKFANHSLNPNTEVRGKSLYAIKPIRVGEEITWHYGEDWEDVK